MPHYGNNGIGGNPANLLVKLATLRSLFILSTDFTDSGYTSDLVLADISPSPISKEQDWRQKKYVVIPYHIHTLSAKP